MTWTLQLGLLITFLLLNFSIAAQAASSAAGIDPVLASTLNSEASHDQNRRQSFAGDRAAKKVFDNERERQLSLFLEEQEKWELIRERGLAEHRRQKKVDSPKEGGPEYRDDLKAKEALDKKYEEARQLVVKTREKMTTQFAKSRDNDEMVELDLLNLRPRFDLRKRGSNKWVKKGGTTSPGSGSAGGGYSPPPAAFDEFPPTQDFIPAPPADNFEDIPPPPPPVNFDGSGGGFGIDSGFGDIPPPPPPPPPLDDDY